MKMIPDRTGRFPERPHYEIEELEEECERIMESFLLSRYGQYSIPVPTEALVELLGHSQFVLHLLGGGIATVGPAHRADLLQPCRLNR